MQARRANLWLLGTLAGFGIVLLLVLWQVRPTYDLAYFLPPPVTPQETVLVERLGQGAGARLIFAEINAAPGADASAQSAQLKQRLGATSLFQRVENGQADLSADSIPRVLWRSRYLLSDLDWSEAGMRRELRHRFDDLATLGGTGIARLIAADPLWAAPQVLERLQFGGGDAQPRWSDGPARAFLVAETAAAPFDIAGQQQAIAVLRQTYAAISAGHGQLELYGVGVYGARIQELIQTESQRLGALATLMVLGVFLFAYRSLRLMFMSVIPLTAGVLGGLLASSLAFGRIHGITIAFGATLVGVVDDYPMHLFSHARHVAPRESVRVLFRTMLASAATTIIAYAALLLSGSRGLAQLGVFSLTGIICAMAVTCWVLPNMMSGQPAARHEDTAQEFHLSPWLWLPMLGLALALIAGSGGIRWNDDLGALTPIPSGLLARDHAMRQRFGAPDVRYLISVTGDSVETALQRTEALERQLPAAQSQHLIRSWSAVTDLLPSAATQARRRAAIPAAEVLAPRMQSARQGLPFRSDAFAPFLADAAGARSLPTLSPADFRGDFTADFVASHLAKSGDQWRSVVYLTGLSSPGQLERWLRTTGPGAELVDLKAASESLLGGYRSRLLAILTGALAVIAVLMAWATGSARRFVWTVGTVTATVTATLAAMNWLHGSVSLFHLVSLVLVAGLGVDYCLSYSRPDVTRTEFRDTRHAVIAGAASTVAAFAILGTSSIPLLAVIGSTVAIGTGALFMAARLGCRAA